MSDFPAEVAVAKQKIQTQDRFSNLVDSQDAMANAEEMLQYLRADERLHPKP